MKNTTQRDDRNKTRSFRAAFAEPAATMDGAIAQIAKDVLGLETLDVRNSDRLDFSEQSVWQLRAALEAAYKAGLAAKKSSKR